MELEYMENIDHYIRCFEELIKEGENSLCTVGKSQYYNKENCTSIFLLYRDFLSYADSFMNLIKIRNLKGMLNQLRTIIEIKANIDYMLSENIEERATAHQVFAIIHKIKMFQKYDKTTEEGKKFHEKLLYDKVISQMRFPECDTSSEVQKLEKIFRRSPYMEVYSKFTKNLKYWYSYNNGPKTMQELCFILGYPMLYENHYKILSGVLHGSDLYYYGLAPGADREIGKIELKSIHGEINVPFIKLGLKLTYLVINNYCEKIFDNYQLPEKLVKIFDS